MREMMMRASYSHLAPTVSLEQSNDFGRSHGNQYTINVISIHHRGRALKEDPQLTAIGLLDGLGSLAGDSAERAHPDDRALSKARQ